jgi:hypothetical protein
MTGEFDADELPIGRPGTPIPGEGIGRSSWNSTRPSLTSCQFAIYRGAVQITTAALLAFVSCS